MAAHAFDDFLADGQPQPGAAKPAVGVRVGLTERLEHLRALFRRHRRLFDVTGSAWRHLGVDQPGAWPEIMRHAGIDVLAGEQAWPVS